MTVMLSMKRSVINAHLGPASLPVRVVAAAVASWVEAVALLVVAVAREGALAEHPLPPSLRFIWIAWG